MDIKEIAVFLTAGAPCEARLALTAALAARHGAHVTAIWLVEPPAVDLADSFVIGPRAVNAVIEDRDAAVEAMVEKTKASFERAIAGRASSYGWRQCGLYATAEERAELAQLADLVMLEAPPPQGGAQLALVQALLSTTAAPCLFLSEGPACAPAPLGHVVVAWNASRAAQRALVDSLSVVREAAAVSVLIVDEPNGRPVTPEQEAQLLRWLSRHGVRARVVRRPAGPGGPGSAILHECADLGAGLLVMGAYGRSRAAEAVFGGVTRTVLHEARMPVFLSR